MQFKHDNTAIGSGDANGILKIWDLREGRLQRNFDGHRLKINSLCFHPNDETSVCATGSQEGRTKLWDIRRKGFYTTFGIKGGAPVHVVRFSPDGRLCAIGDEDGLKIWDLMNTADPVLSLPLLKCKKIQFHPREWLLAATSYAQGLSRVHFVDLETMKEETSVNIGNQEIREVSFHCDKPALLVISNDNVDVVGWSPNDVFDHMPTNHSGSVISATSNETKLLMMSDSNRCSGVINAVDLTQVRLTRPTTPMTVTDRQSIIDFYLFVFCSLLLWILDSKNLNFRSNFMRFFYYFIIFKELSDIGKIGFPVQKSNSRLYFRHYFRFNFFSFAISRSLQKASRKQFEDSRPGTMEAFIGNDEQVRHIEDEVAEINIASPSKLALLFPGIQPPTQVERSNTEIKRANVPRADFNKALQVCCYLFSQFIYNL